MNKTSGDTRIDKDNKGSNIIPNQNINTSKPEQSYTNQVSTSSSASSFINNNTLILFVVIAFICSILSIIITLLIL